MPSIPRRSPSHASPSPGRRILSRIASPFASKSRSLTDFYIEPDDPHKQHSPGDKVTGSVRLRVLKPIRVTHLVVRLHGYVQVYKNPGSPGEGYRSNTDYVGAARGTRSGEYFGNGFATLFEDEIVLCGDGRLADGAYQFNFILKFPERDLPSSIDFERGTISYMITAAITRPTTISPTITCDRKVFLVERIDISNLYPPKPRTITLEPITKRSKARKLIDHADRRSHRTDSEQHSEQDHDGATSRAPSSQADGDAPLSPAQTYISVDSQIANSDRTSQHEASSASPGTSGSGKTTHADRKSSTNKTITAAIESCAGGCLRGDNVAVKVKVNHTKHVKSLTGVIVTLYRQARVDMHPAIPLGPTEKGTKPKYEDYYPKSFTGFGGLSLSGAGSSHVFRKDLAQVVQPLMVDPGSLTAEVTAKVRVPEEAFPTISTVPGAMISFRYYLEVIVDIQGKLTGHDRALSNLGTLASPVLTNNEAFDGTNTQSGSPAIDTTPIRRDAGVISCTFEVIVGTRDSERRNGKRKLDALPLSQPQEPDSQVNQDRQTEAYNGTARDVQYPPDDYQYHQLYYGADPWTQPGLDAYNYYDYYGGYDEPPPEVPMPHLPDESQLSEKERIRQAETRLLPSQPPGLEQTVLAEPSEATAPFIPEEHELHIGASSSQAHVALESSRHIGGVQAQQGASAQVPEYAPPEPGSSHQAEAVVASDDKQEIQRRRLQMETSAPPAEEVGEGEGQDGPSDRSENHPSAPVLQDTDAGADADDSHADVAGMTDLPRYER